MDGLYATITEDNCGLVQPPQIYLNLSRYWDLWGNKILKNMQLLGLFVNFIQIWNFYLKYWTRVDIMQQFTLTNIIISYMYGAKLVKRMVANIFK